MHKRGVLSRVPSKPSDADVTITVGAWGADVEALELRALADPPGVVGAGIPDYRPRRPGHGVLDPRRVSELAAGTPIEDLGATLAGFARGGFALLASESTESSWLGGQPHLPVDAPWPGGVHGAMTFVAQLSLADLDPAVWTGRIPQRMVKPRRGLTLPDEDAALMRPLGLGFGGKRRSDIEHLSTLRQRLYADQGWHRHAGQLLGWPTWQNDDNMDDLASLRNGQELELTLLLQTDALDAELHVVVPIADLAAARFDRAEATIEHD